MSFLVSFMLLNFTLNFDFKKSWKKLIFHFWRLPGLTWNHVTKARTMPSSIACKCLQPFGLRFRIVLMCSFMFCCQSIMWFCVNNVSRLRQERGVLKSKEIVVGQNLQEPHRVAQINIAYQTFTHLPIWINQTQNYPGILKSLSTYLAF